VHSGDLARGCSNLKMTWLLCCAGAATAQLGPHQSVMFLPQPDQ